MSANPWNPATFTNASQVKTNTPDEMNALKQVNLDRGRFLAEGNTAVVNGIVPDGGGDFGPIAIRWTQAALNRGTYSNATGEYICDQTGYYRVEAMVNAFIAGSLTDLTVLGFYIQKFHAAAWSDVKRVEPIAVAYGDYYFLTGAVSLTSGDKLRVVIRGNYSSPGDRSISDMGDLDSSFILEFIRTP